MISLNKQCELCHTPFLTTNKLKRFCTLSCSNSYSNKRRRVAAIWSISAEDFAGDVKEAKSWSDLARAVSGRLGPYKDSMLKRRVKIEQLSTNHFTRYGSARLRELESSVFERVFIQGSSRKLPKRWLNKLNLLEKKCEVCSITDNWQGKPIVLELDHKNGDPGDNRLENLRWLCPNCHSQTETYCGRNIARSKARRTTI